MFIDRATIRVRGGRGGDGCLSFYRGKYLPKGGPNGGDGGKGGDVILAADPGLNTLMDFKGVRDWFAESGESGRGKQQYGAAAPDRVVRVPAGTVVYDATTGEQVADIGPGDRVVIARGGKGGYGNEHFKSSTEQAPRRTTPGALGEDRTLRLELMLIADIGLVGLPNAGKSSLLASLTRATPKIADYPFTTLSPQLGIATLDETRRLVIADIPGLIEGAADGAGLGHDFLRHTARTRAIVHVVDPLPESGSPAANYRTVRAEISAYSAELAAKPEVIALSKADLFPDAAELADIRRAFCAGLRPGAEVPVFLVSAATGDGLGELLAALWKTLHPRGGGEERGWGGEMAR